MTKCSCAKGVHEGQGKDGLRLQGPAGGWGISTQLVLQRSKIGIARGRVLLLLLRGRTSIQRTSTLIPPTALAARGAAAPAVAARRPSAALRGMVAAGAARRRCIEADIVAQALKHLQGGVLPRLLVAPGARVAGADRLKLAAVDDQAAAGQAAGWAGVARGEGSVGLSKPCRKHCWTAGHWAAGK